jgi:Putative zinc binding domain
MASTMRPTIVRRPMNDSPLCRFCGGSLADFVDLGMSPLCESYVAPDQLNAMEPFYPLAAYVCRDCFLVQLQEYVAPEHIFSEYAYFSAFSDAWLEHARHYVAMITERLGLGPASRVIELGSNDRSWPRGPDYVSARRHPGRRRTHKCINVLGSGKVDNTSFRTGALERRQK